MNDTKQTVEHTPGELFLAGSVDEDVRGMAENDTDLIAPFAPVELGSSRVRTEVVATMVEGYTRANAERLAHCWNCHDALLEALRELERCSVAADQQSLPDDREFWNAVGKARAAIAKAEPPTD